MTFSPRVVSAGAILGLLAGLVLGLGAARSHGFSSGSGDDLSDRFEAAAALVEPAVVTIEVEEHAEIVLGVLTLPNGQILSQGAPHKPRVEGAGVIINADGYIVTNRHVIDGAERIEVKLGANADQPLLAHVVGVDTDSDLALLKVASPQPLPVAHFGDAKRVRVGQWVEAIGSPFGLDHSVSAGIVSAVYRDPPPPGGGSQYEHYIQTDAAINPGNSGGPLIDLSGAVIGIDTAIYSQTDGYEGIGFALPSTLVRPVVEQLMAHGKVARGTIGVYFQSKIDPAVRRVYGLRQGVPVSLLEKDGPAMRAGLRAGDIIETLNGAPVGDGDSLVAGIVYSPINHPVAIGYLRDGEIRTAQVTVMDRSTVFKAEVDAGPKPAPPAPTPAASSLGLTLQDSTQPAGAKINGVQSDTYAYRVGLQPGDIVVEFNRHAIANRVQLQALIDRVKEGQDVAMVVLRPAGVDIYQRNLLGGPYQP